MAVISTPVSAHVRFAYTDDAPDLQINGISPSATAMQVLNLSDAVTMLQDAIVTDGFLSVETELSED